MRVAALVMNREHLAVETPETRYARTADHVSIAYQITGSGPPDLVLINSSFTSNVDGVWEFPLVSYVLNELATPPAAGW